MTEESGSLRRPPPAQFVLYAYMKIVPQWCTVIESSEVTAMQQKFGTIRFDLKDVLTFPEMTCVENFQLATDLIGLVYSDASPGYVQYDHC